MLKLYGFRLTGIINQQTVICMCQVNHQLRTAKRTKKIL